MKKPFLFLLLSVLCLPCVGQKAADESVVTRIDDKYPDVRIAINAPARMDKRKPTQVLFYALPNGNTIEWTAGKKMYAGDDWHYDIQHIAAQTRFLREKGKKYNFVVVYLMAAGKSWGAWRSLHKEDKTQILPAIVDDIMALYADYRPSAVLSGHSGGGYFVFEYIRALDTIPDKVKRIVFLDSTYGYEDSLHVEKLADWLGRSKKHYLCVTSYEDATVVIDGKHIVSASGGTWGRSFAMEKGLGQYLPLKRTETGDFIYFNDPKKQVFFKLKKNPDGKIYHTVLVERNGFIDTVLEGTSRSGKGYEFWAERAYGEYIPEKAIQ